MSESSQPWVTPAARTSFDDLDAPWSDPYPVEERRSSRPSSERPSVEDFQTTWDGAYDAEEPEAEEPAAPPPTNQAGDPLWDAPAVSQTIAETPTPFESEDVAAVWSEREAPPEPFVSSWEEPPKKPGFFARLFGRKQKPESGADDERITAAAEAWAIDIAELTEEAGRQPADADFAEDTAASTAPADADFAENATAPADADFAENTTAHVAPGASDFFGRTSPPSTDHSAEDAAKLAALLGPITPQTADADDVTQQIPLAHEPADLAEPEEVHAPEEEAAMAALVDEPQFDDIEPLDSAPSVASEPPVDALPEAPAASNIFQETSLDKKPGFFSNLLKRVSRSQFIPKAAVEPEPALEAEPIAEMEITSVESVDVELVDEAPEVEASTPVNADLRWAPPVEAAPEPDHAPAVEPESDVVAQPQPPGRADLESTQPFPAFRDARDDFAEEPVDDLSDGGRRTEEVELTPFDEGEKTDEFEVIPPTSEDASLADAETVGFFGRVFGKKAVETPAPEAPEPVVPSHTIAEDDGKIPFVLAKFRSFYNEVIRDKHQKSDVISGFATAILSSTPENTGDPEFAAQLLSKRLSEMLELQAAESNWTGGDAAKYYLEAQYAMVALADETFATIDWPGRPHWHKYMLEPRMYGTRGADIEFFKRIDKLLKDNPDPPKGARDLARVYLLVIASGFRGKFRVPNVRRPLAEYRRRLYEFSHRVDPLELYARDRRLLPEAFAHTLESRAVGRFSSAQKWVAAVLILAVLYLGVSQFAWTRLSAELKDVMAHIEITGGAGGKTP